MVIDRQRALVGGIVAVAVALAVWVAVRDGSESPGRPRVLDVPPGAEQHFYAIEAKGTLCGYAHIVLHPTELEGHPVLVQRQKTVVLMSLLDTEVNTEIDQTYHLDPESGMYSHYESLVRQGPSSFEMTIDVADDTARIDSTLGGKGRTVALPPDTLLAGTLLFPHLEQAFADPQVESIRFVALEANEARVQEIVYQRVGAETLELAGATYEALIVDEVHAAGSTVRLWIDRDTGHFLQGNLPNERRIYRASPKVVRRIEVADVNEDFVARVGVLIPDFQSITYMKVRAVFRPTGGALSPEDLAVPGQTFSGTVERNRVEGVFEIRHPRYDGSGAPSFPPKLSEFGKFDPVDELAESLQPGFLIESDDPVLQARALEITAGAADSWEASRRLASWVAENIAYAIPGGGTARRTYDLRAGECGSHSALVAAFCRSVGIPARIVWGCQYIPSFGGAFGQHGWNEVYMGETAGWVPLDATSFEPDYVDSGHIRISDLRSTASALNPVEMEILEYALNDGEVIIPSSLASPSRQEPPARYAGHVGHYSAPDGRVFEVRAENGALVVALGNEKALPLEDPGPDGVWACKLTPRVYFTFDEGKDGRVAAMWVHELTRMSRTSPPEKVSSKAPEELHGHLGTYLLAARNAEYPVSWRHGSLAVRDPTSGRYSRLERSPDEADTWVSQTSGNRIKFERNEAGAIEGLILESKVRLERQPSRSERS